MANDKPFLMPKPESAQFLSKLEDCIVDSGYTIDSIWKVTDWYTTAKKLYGDQIAASSSFNAGFEGHAWLLNYFFGNRSLILRLHKEETSPREHKYMETLAIKEKFRQDMRGCYDESFVAHINFSKIPELKQKMDELQYTGQEGYLGTSKDGTFTSLENNKYHGKWDYIYFKYVHCPEPEMHEKELGLLAELGIFRPQNRISPEDWECMKYQKTLIPPSEVKR